MQVGCSEVSSLPDLTTGTIVSCSLACTVVTYVSVCLHVASAHTAGHRVVKQVANSKTCVTAES